MGSKKLTKNSVNKALKKNAEYLDLLDDLALFIFGIPSRLPDTRLAVEQFLERIEEIARGGE